jgi:hypothetical protein
MANRSALEEAAQLYSDAHKDAFGFRPREGGVYNPQTLEEYEDAIGKCAEVIGREEREEDRRAAFSLLAWESQLAAMQALGATDRATAIRWHIQSLGYEGDFSNWDCQEVESALYGTYPIRIWGILLSEVWPTYTMCGVRMDLTDEQKAELDAQRAREKKNFMTGYRPTWEELGQAA